MPKISTFLGDGATQNATNNGFVEIMVQVLCMALEVTSNIEETFLVGEEWEGAMAGVSQGQNNTSH